MNKIEQLPNHVAIIMDGNGRWATTKNQPRLFGHSSGIDAVLRTLEYMTSIGIKYVTLYTFSTENWNRPSDEINGLFELLLSGFAEHAEKLNENNVRVLHTGRTDRLSAKVMDTIEKTKKMTENNTGCTLCLAIDYGGKQEITDAVKKIIAKGIPADQITEKTIEDNLYVPDMPPVDLVIRTAGEKRISNFLIWQSAYAEYYSTDTLWPDFDKKDIDKALEDYSMRTRKFGAVC